jgi:hypothetical protein
MWINYNADEIGIEVGNKILKRIWVFNLELDYWNILLLEYIGI